MHGDKCALIAYRTRRCASSLDQSVGILHRDRSDELALVVDCVGNVLNASCFFYYSSTDWISRSIRWRWSFRGHCLLQSSWTARFKSKIGFSTFSTALILHLILYIDWEITEKKTTRKLVFQLRGPVGTFVSCIRVSGCTEDRQKLTEIEKEGNRFHKHLSILFTGHSLVSPKREEKRRSIRSSPRPDSLLWEWRMPSCRSFRQMR